MVNQKLNALPTEAERKRTKNCGFIIRSEMFSRSVSTSGNIISEEMREWTFVVLRVARSYRLKMQTGDMRTPIERETPKEGERESERKLDILRM